MSPKNGHGCSESTRTKQSNFREFINMHLKISKSVMRVPWADNDYHYFDITAGPGADDHGPASPLIFLQEAFVLDVPYRAVFIEQHFESYKELVSRTRHIKNIEIRQGDHTEILPEYLYPATDKKFIGLLYADPNGMAPFDLLELVGNTPAFRRLDFLVNVPANVYKRAKSEKRVADLIAPIKKKHWLIREPISGWQWTMLFGTQMDKPRFPELKSIGFHHLDSPEGLEILKRLSLTKEEIGNGKQIVIHNGSLRGTN